MMDSDSPHLLHADETEIALEASCSLPGKTPATIFHKKFCPRGARGVEVDSLAFLHTF